MTTRVLAANPELLERIESLASVDELHKAQDRRAGREVSDSQALGS